MLILLVTISIGFSSFSNFNITAASPTEPVFEGFTAEGYENTNAINFVNKTIITVKYSVDRYANVKGINIFGSGSNLSVLPIEGLALNFSYNLKSRTYYEGSFRLTSFTKFKGYAWVGEVTNGTFEVIDVFNHLDAWHYLYVNEEGTPPDFSRISNVTSTLTPGVYRATANKTEKPIVVFYKVYSGTPEDDVTLAISVYRDKIINASLNIFDSYVNFIKMNFSSEHETYVEFNATIEFTVRTLYFCANNSFGWDTWESSSNELHSNLNIKALYNGYDFYSQPTSEGKITDVDNIRFNITTLNTTDIESFGLSYYVQESSENDTIIVPWTEIGAILNQTYTEINENKNTDTIHEYIVSIGTFNSGNIIHYEAYNIYYGEYYNETAGNLKKLAIYDSKPNLALYPVNNSYISKTNITFWYTAGIARGEIYNVSLDFGDGTPLKDLTTDMTNKTYHIYPQLTGEYKVTLYYTVNITRETEVPILVSNSISTRIYLDFEPPYLNIVSRTSNETKIVDGYVQLYLQYYDNYSEIFRVWIFWGDGTVQNVTGDNFVFHYYTKSGNYTVIIMAEDNARNQNNVTITYNIVLTTKTQTVPTPYEFISVIFSLILVGFIVKKKNRKMK